MPNWTTNYLVILGEKEEVDKCVEAFTTIHESKPRMAHDGIAIYSPGKISIRQRLDKQEKGKPTCGWYDKDTDTFTFKPANETRKGIPEGWKPDMTKREVQFPDFNKVIPQPENIFQGDLGRKEREMCQKEGIPNWYDWNCANWGTKWNSSSCDDVGGEFIFSTAWCGVPNIIEKMAEKFPNLTFEYRCDHEDGGGEYFTFGGEE